MRKMINLFCYGTLQFESVFKLIVSNAYSKDIAVLDGYRRVCIKNETYPALIKSDDGSQTQGTLYYQVTPDDLKSLDHFEGDEYQRIPVPVKTSGNFITAETYIWIGVKDLLINQEWNSEWFQQYKISEFIESYKGFIEK